MPSHAAPADTRCSFSRIGRACSCRSRCIRERLTVSREAGLHSPPVREECLVPVGRDRSRPARRVEPGDLLRREAPPEGAEVLHQRLLVRPLVNPMRTTPLGPLRPTRGLMTSRPSPSSSDGAGSLFNHGRDLGRMREQGHVA